MGKVIAVCTREAKGTQKVSVPEIEIKEDWRMTPTQETGIVRSVFCLMKK